MPEKKYDPEHHHHPGPAPFPVDRCADECDDQLPLFSQVGRGLQGDGYYVALDENGSTLSGYFIDPRTGETTPDWTTTIDHNSEELIFSYSYRPWTNPKTFTMTFVYQDPDTKEVIWEFTTPAIPYTRPEGEDDIGSGVATLYIKKKGDTEWVEKLVYPNGIDHESAHAPEAGEGWTVNLKYGVKTSSDPNSEGYTDIDVPSTDDFAKIIGVNNDSIIHMLNNGGSETIADNSLKAYIDRSIYNMLAPIGTIWLYSGNKGTVPTNWKICDGSKIKKSEYPELGNIINDSFITEEDGTEWINLPDLTRRFPLGALFDSGAKDPVGETGGAKRVTLTQKEIPQKPHHHKLSSNDDKPKLLAVPERQDGVRGEVRSAKAAYGLEKTDTVFKYELSAAEDSAAGGAWVRWTTSYFDINDPNGNDNEVAVPHENMPPYIRLYYIIRVK